MDINHSEYERILFGEKFSKRGLNSSLVTDLRSKYGNNSLGKRKKTKLIVKILKALSEPMILILTFACIITFGVNLGNKLAGKESDFYECFGIIGAILLSVGLTVYMENKSENAFEKLKKLSDFLLVTVIRDGQRKVINYEEVVVGDLILYEMGDKIVADSLIIECNELETEESILSGEVVPINKKSYTNGNIKSENMLYSGTYIKAGSVKSIVLAVGKSAQIGKIASNLSTESALTAPLSHKLNQLSKKVSIFGGVAATVSFILTLFRLYLINGLNYETAKDAFIQAVVLIVAAVPEGLPATIAIALTLSVVKLAKSNAVIKKLIAAETVGCVSVICSDKTGTLTVGKMQVSKYIASNGKNLGKNLPKGYLYENAVYNSTAYFAFENQTLKTFGNSTEQALIVNLFEKNYNQLAELRNSVKIVKRQAFSSKRKYMQTTVEKDSGEIVGYIKGAVEKILPLCNLSAVEFKNIINKAEEYAKRGERIIAFAHKVRNETWVYDGLCVICDELRPEVYKAVKDCKKAGISVKILTGDNIETAKAIAMKIGVLTAESKLLTGKEIEEMSDSELREIINSIAVVARSTPETKLKIVKALKLKGEIVAVTGDGVNDAPAIKNADIGIAMGDGSEITKETADIVLLNNSFSVIVKAIAFGRNIYRNFQRFIFFQLTANFSAVAIVIIFLLLGFEPPFLALQLLWINVIMDGPLAVSLGVERRENDYMEDKPVKRNSPIVSKKTFIRTLLHASLITVVVVLQKLYNFMQVNANEIQSVIFSTFVFFQLFNAVNAREIGNESILKSLGKNKAFSILLAVCTLMQIVITQFFGKVFYTTPLTFITWIKIFALTFAIILFSEIYKLTYRVLKKKNLFKK